MKINWHDVSFSLREEFLLHKVQLIVVGEQSLNTCFISADLTHSILEKHSDTWSRVNTLDNYMYTKIRGERDIQVHQSVLLLGFTCHLATTFIQNWIVLVKNFLWQSFSWGFQARLLVYKK